MMVPRWCRSQEEEEIVQIVSVGLDYTSHKTYWVCDLPFIFHFFVFCYLPCSSYCRPYPFSVKKIWIYSEKCSDNAHENNNLGLKEPISLDLKPDTPH